MKLGCETPEAIVVVEIVRGAVAGKTLEAEAGEIRAEHGYLSKKLAVGPFGIALLSVDFSPHVLSHHH